MGPKQQIQDNNKVKHKIYIKVKERRKWINTDNKHRKLN